VFHAAAHKHVPLMELNPCEAVKNNVIGTRMVAEAADLFGVDRFILISTDKAVNPTSLMGATKRAAELVIQAMAFQAGPRWGTVRFGNVLASTGSVVPRWLEQIAAGGPVTVTHSEARRYFMLIPEAVHLILRAATVTRGGEIFALEMGEQINLLKMARDLIRLSGFIPDEEIAITITGLRPGEKLSEELVGPDEHMECSPIEKILQLRAVTPPDPMTLLTEVTDLSTFALRGDPRLVIDQLCRIVPTFQPGELLIQSSNRDCPPTLPGRAAVRTKRQRPGAVAVHIAPQHQAAVQTIAAPEGSGNGSGVTLFAGAASESPAGYTEASSEILDQPPVTSLRVRPSGAHRTRELIVVDVGSDLETRPAGHSVRRRSRVE